MKKVMVTTGNKRKEAYMFSFSYSKPSPGFFLEKGKPVWGIIAPEPGNSPGFLFTFGGTVK